MFQRFIKWLRRTANQAWVDANPERKQEDYSWFGGEVDKELAPIIKELQKK